MSLPLTLARALNRSIVAGTYSSTAVSRVRPLFFSPEWVEVKRPITYTSRRDAPTVPPSHAIRRAQTRSFWHLMGSRHVWRRLNLFEKENPRQEKFNPFWIAVICCSIASAAIGMNRSVFAEEITSEELSWRGCQEAATLLEIAGYTPNPSLSSKRQLEDFRAVCFASAYQASKNGEWKKIEALQEKRLLLQMFSREKENLFLHAIRIGDRQTFDAFLSRRLLYKEVDLEGNHPLHYLARFNRSEWMSKLRGWNVHVPNHKNELPIHLAIREGNLSAMYQLVQMGMDLTLHIHMDSGYLLSLVGYALYYGRLDSIKALLQLDPSQRASLSEEINTIGSLLHLSIARGHKKELDAFLELLGKEKESLLHRFDEAGRLPFHVACMEGNLYAIRALLATGQDLDVLDREGRSGFHLAALGLQPEVIYDLFLLMGKEKGKQILSLPDPEGRLPIDCLGTDRGVCRQQLIDLITSSGGEIPIPLTKRCPDHLIFGFGSDIMFISKFLYLMQKHGAWDQVVDVGGYGSGVLLAPLLALGFKPESIYIESFMLLELNLIDSFKTNTKELFKLDEKSEKFEINSWDPFEISLNLGLEFFKYLFSYKDPMEEVFESLLSKKREELIEQFFKEMERMLLQEGLSPQITFNQLHEKVCVSHSVFKDLHLFSPSQSGKLKVLNWENCGDQPILKVLRDTLDAYFKFGGFEKEVQMPHPKITQHPWEFLVLSDTSHASHPSFLELQMPLKLVRSFKKKVLNR